MLNTKHWFLVSIRSIFALKNDFRSIKSHQKDDLLFPINVVWSKQYKSMFQYNWRIFTPLICTCLCTNNKQWINPYLISPFGTLDWDAGLESGVGPQALRCGCPLLLRDGLSAEYTFNCTLCIYVTNKVPLPLPFYYKTLHTTLHHTTKVQLWQHLRHYCQKSITSNFQKLINQYISVRPDVNFL